MNDVAPLHRSLEQELLAVLRGASLECPVCGEFVLHEPRLVRCPECGFVLHARHEANVVPVEFGVQAG